LSFDGEISLSPSKHSAECGGCVVFHPANLSAVESVAGFSSPSEFPVMGDFFNFLKGYPRKVSASFFLPVCLSGSGTVSPARKSIAYDRARNSRVNDLTIGESTSSWEADQWILRKPSVAPTNAWSRFSYPLTTNLRLSPHSGRSSAHFREFRYADLAFAGIAFSAGKGGA
jgi:hypothetical protein